MRCISPRWLCCARGRKVGGGGGCSPAGRPGLKVLLLLGCAMPRFFGLPGGVRKRRLSALPAGCIMLPLRPRAGLVAGCRSSWKLESGRLLLLLALLCLSTGVFSRFASRPGGRPRRDFFLSLAAAPSFTNFPSGPLFAAPAPGRGAVRRGGVRHRGCSETAVGWCF